MNWLCKLFPRICKSNNNNVLPDNPPILVPGNTLEIQWLTTLNQERSSRGKSKMILDPKLMMCAQQWAEEMADSDVLSHGDFAGRMASVYPNTYGAENIAYGSSDVNGTNAQWKASPDHWANMMGNYNRTGIGKQTSRSGNVYWCADFVLD